MSGIHTSLISQILRCNLFSFASRNHRHHHKLWLSVSLSVPLCRSYFNVPISDSSPKLLIFAFFSLSNSFPQTGYPNFIPAHTFCSQSGIHAFDRTPGGQGVISSDDDKLHENDSDYGSDKDKCDQTSSGVVSISNDGEKLYTIIIDCKPNSPENSTMEKFLNQAGVQLTTPLVLEVLGCLRFEEKFAFRFFTWAGNQEHYSHEPEAYNEMIDILSNTKYKAKQYRILCDVLDYMKRHNKISVPMEALLKILKQYADKHLTHLHKFAKKKKAKLKKMQPEIDAFNVLLDAFCKCCLVEDGETMFMKIKKNVKPNASTYNILFFGWCRVWNPSRAMKVLDEMIEMGYTPENFTYNTAIDTFCKAGMVTEAAELFEFMRVKGDRMSSPTAKTYAILIVAFAHSNRTEECFKLVEDMAVNGCLPDVSTYRELIEGMCVAGKVEAAYKFLEEMGNKGYPPDIVTYNCFLKALCDSKHSEEALRLYKKMVEVGCVPSVQSFNMLVRMFFKLGDEDGALEAWREMDRRRCVRDTDSYCAMIEGLFGCGRTEDACALLEEVVHKGMKLPYQKFDSFLMKLSGIGDLRAIHRLSEHMRKFYNPVMARRFALSEKRKIVGVRRK